MSTFIGSTSQTLLESEKPLHDYFQRHAKPRSGLLVGLELEIFAVNRESGRALPYSGAGGIEKILQRMVSRFHYTPVEENGHIIALRRKDAMITLEPGGQVELSAPPVVTLFEVEWQIARFFSELHLLKDDFQELEWIAFGIQPFSTSEDIERVPKVRYGMMAEHFKTRGALSHDMMKCTATNQVNFDYLNEDDAMDSLRTALGITSIVSALFANSSFSGGAPNGFLTRRLEIWNHTDPDRTGIVPLFLEPGRTFQDYLEYLLQMPMLFIVREGRWLMVPNRSFRQFIRHGFEHWRATLEDFELHLSAAFPEVRLKQYLEVRGADCQPPKLIPAVAAFWKGILYRQDARREAWKLVADASMDERRRLHQEVPRLGLSAKLGGWSSFDIARELIEVSYDSLAKQGTGSGTRSECQFLTRLREQIRKPRQSSAEQFLTWYRSETFRSPCEIVDYLRIGGVRDRA